MQQERRNRSDGVAMRALKLNGTAEQQQRISDELRQLKLMSKGLRTKSLRALMERHATERHATKRLDAKRLPPPVKVPRPAAAA
jgi:hypothetical protein